MFTNSVKAHCSPDFPLVVLDVGHPTDVVKGGLIGNGHAVLGEGISRRPAVVGDIEVDLFKIDSDAISQCGKPRHWAKELGDEGELDFAATFHRDQGEFGDGGDATHAAGAVGHFDGDHLTARADAAAFVGGKDLGSRVFHGVREV